MSAFDRKDLIVILAVLIFGFAAIALGLKMGLKGGDIGILLGAYLGPVCTLYAIARGAEWYGRAKDPSPITEQEAAARGGK